MKKTILHISAIAAVTVVCFGFTGSNETPDKITICHIPPGNPGNCHEITISVNALETHRGHHGDRLVCHRETENDYYLRLAREVDLALVCDYQ